jgi:5-methylcytosine-specific restriction endonuclease McrA
MLKRCCACGAEKPLEEFHNAKAHRDGKSSRCKPCAISIASAWNRDNINKARRNSRNCFAKHKEQRKAQVARRYELFPEEMKFSRRLITHRRRERLRNASHTLALADWKALVAYEGNVCVCCKQPSPRLEIDHIVPVALGGGHDLANVQPLCRRCNASKHTDIIDYRTWIPLANAPSYT